MIELEMTRPCGKCAVCGGAIVMRRDGTIGRHKARNGTTGPCAGVGQPPTELIPSKPVKGQPSRRRPLMERFLLKVNKEGPPPPRRSDFGPCWIWTGGGSPEGYGIAYLGPEGKKQDLAHRVAYRELVGPIPDGLVLDHLCSVRRCVNPEHLEPVTQKVNVLRAPGVAAANAAKETCLQGHPFSGTNLRVNAKGWRTCRQCEKEKHERQRRARGAQPKRKPNCPSGHAFTPENTGTKAGGRRYCKECSREYQRTYKRKPRSAKSGA